MYDRKVTFDDEKEKNIAKNLQFKIKSVILQA